MTDLESDVTAKTSQPLRFDVFTLFPNMFRGPLDESIIQRGRDRGRIQINIHDIREWSTDRHRTVDDTPYGGGAGMVMRPQSIVEAVEQTLLNDLPQTQVLILSPAGQRFDQEFARDLATAPRIALICGRYEGIDDRVREVLGAREVTIGDYVLTGGELPAMVILDAVARLVPGVIDEASMSDESFSHGLVEYPQYTRPADYRGRVVPEILLSGHHANVNRWRRKQAIIKTAKNRPDLLRATMAGGSLTPDERTMALELLATHPADDDER